MKGSKLPVLLLQASEAAEVIKADDLMGSIRSLRARTLEILKSAETAGQLETALKAIREVRGILELLARLSGELEASTPGSTTVQCSSPMCIRRLVAA